MRPLTPYEREERVCDALSSGVRLVMLDPQDPRRPKRVGKKRLSYRWRYGRTPPDYEICKHLRDTGHCIGFEPSTAGLATFGLDEGRLEDLLAWLGDSVVSYAPSRTPGRFHVYARVPHDAKLPKHARIGGCEVDVTHDRQFTPCYSTQALDAVLYALTHPLAGRPLPAEKIAALGPVKPSCAKGTRVPRHERGKSLCAGMRRDWLYTRSLLPEKVPPGHRNAKLHVESVLHFARRPKRPSDREILSFKRRLNRRFPDPLPKEEVCDEAALRTIRTGIARLRANPHAYGGPTAEQRQRGGRTRGAQQTRRVKDLQREAHLMRLGGMSLAKIARRQGCARSTVRRRIAAAARPSPKPPARISSCIPSGRPPAATRATRPASRSETLRKRSKDPPWAARSPA